MTEKREGSMALIELAIEPRSEADRERLDVALGEMAAADPTFGYHFDWKDGQTILTGVDEWQLDQKIDVLRRVYEVQADVGAPQVAYRETLGCAREIDHTHKRQRGGEGEFARVRIQFAPGEPGSGFVFQSRIVGGAVPEEYIPGIEKGLESARQNGLLAGFPMIDFIAVLVDGAFHDIDSSELAFEIAARHAFGELREKGAPKLLEPIMRVEVVTPAEYLGDVIGDLNSRRGLIEGAQQRGDLHVTTALVPLANMFGYIGVVRHLFDGRVQFTMHYDHHGQTPDPDPEPPTFPPAIGMRA